MKRQDISFIKDHVTIQNEVLAKHIRMDFNRLREEKEMISVLLCTLNRPVLIKDCISSFLAQSYTDFEIIVVDQSKDDETEKSCKSFADDRIRYHHVNFTGLSRARNYGLRFAKGEWICLGDDDAIYSKDYFRTAVDFLKKHNDSCILCGHIFYLDDREKEAFNYTKYNNGQALNADDMIQAGPSPALILPAKMLKRIKGFDTLFGVGAKYGSGEETDVVLRLFKEGAEAYYLNEMILFHGKSDDEVCPDLKKVLFYYIGLGALLKKHLWIDKNLALFPKFARATLGAWIKWLIGDRNQKAIYRMRIAGFHKGFFVYKK